MLLSSLVSLLTHDGVTFGLTLATFLVLFLVVGYPHDIKGNALMAYVILYNTTVKVSTKVKPDKVTLPLFSTVMV